MGAIIPVTTATPAVAQASNKALLLSSAAKADAANAIDLPPWTLPAAWVSGHTYVTGNVFTANGNVYTTVFGGTSGTTAPSQTYPIQMFDGTAIHAFVSGLSITASDALAPVTTTGGNSALYGLGYTNIYLPYSQTSNFTILDCASLTSIFGAAQPNGWAQGNGTFSEVSGAIAFETEASSFAISYSYASGYSFRVMVDGRWNTIGPENVLTTQTGSNNYNYTLFTFPGGAKTRRIVIDCSNPTGNQATIYNIITKGNDQIRPIKVNATMAAISDSWGGGAGWMQIVGNRWPQQLAKLLGFDQCLNFSIGGTGHVNQGTASAFYNFPQRIPVLIAALQAAGAAMPNLWVIAGSINDNGQTAAAIQAGVAACISAIRAASPAPIVFFGVQPVPADNTAVFVATTALSTTLNITAKTSGTVAIGDKITCSGNIPAGTTCTGYGTYSTTTGTGTITLSQAATYAASGLTGYSNAGAQSLVNEAAQLAAVVASGDPLVFYVPIYGDVNGPWISGAWNCAARPYFVNSALLGNDNTHSYDVGYSYWARKMQQAIRAKVYPAL